MQPMPSFIVIETPHVHTGMATIKVDGTCSPPLLFQTGSGYRPTLNNAR